VEYKLSNPVDGSNKIVVYRDSSLGKGATATVYRATINGGNYAAKIYHDKSKLNTKKIEAMIANPPDNLTGETAGVVYPRYSWPLSIIEDDSGNSVGYVMPLIDLQESFTLDHYYDKNLGKKLNSPDEVALSYKLEIAANLSRLISHLHSHGHYFIDFKPQNIRVFKRTHAVTLIDCDGFSIKSPAGQIYPAELLSTDYISPEAFRGHKSASELSEDQDRYALATIIFQLLNGGIHPFQGITTGQISVPTNDEKAAQGLYPHGVVSDPRIQARPQSIHNCLDDSTRTLFDKAFMGLPTHRPSATEWANHLDGLLKNKMLTRCEQHPYDIRHMKFMGKDCPECQLQKIQVTKPAKQKSSVKLPPITNDSFSSPIPAAASTGIDPGIKVVLIGVGLVIFIGFLIAMFKNGNSSQPYTPPVVKNTQPSYSPPPAAPAVATGYASIYVDLKSQGFAWATGYPTQEEADSAARSGCQKRGATADCTRSSAGPFKCVALYESAEWRHTALGNTKYEAESAAKRNCENKSGVGTCNIPEKGSSCAMQKEKVQPKPVAEKPWQPPASDRVVQPPGVIQPTETIGWITAVYPKYGYVEFDIASGKYPYSGQVLVSSYSGRKYRIAKINGKRASAEPVETSTPILNEVGYSLMQ
jgi:serine/threonine protein kinase